MPAKMEEHDKDEVSNHSDATRNPRLLVLNIQAAVSISEQLKMQEYTVWNKALLVTNLLAEKIKNRHLKRFHRSSSTFQAYLHKRMHAYYPFSKTPHVLHWKMFVAANNAVSDIGSPYSSTFKM